MGIGSSKGAFHEDEFRMEAAQWFIDPKEIDDNIVNPDSPNAGEFSDNTERFTQDKNIIIPGQLLQNKQLEDIELSPSTGMGIEVNMKNKMPFPSNRNPDAEFDSRFGNLPPSGILNDLKKPTGETVPLARKISNEIPVYEMNGEQAKARLGSLLRDKASSKKAGVDVDGSDYMFYNTLIRQLRDHLKNQ